MAGDVDISVVLTTFNRRDSLLQTLRCFTELQYPGRVEFVVVDNNSTDDTAEVINSFSDKLPLHHVFESRPGKSAALNRALSEVPLGKLVVFTDDDVVPNDDWLVQIVATSARWPDYDIFGGRIYLIWPHIDIPAWARTRQVQGWAYGLHDLGEEERPYKEPYFPVGINFWVRREALGDHRYDVGVGPRPAKRAMGCETAFLKSMAAEGHKLLYAPHATVGHCLQETLLTDAGIKRKAYAYGRGGPHVWGLCRPELLKSHPWLWRALRAASLGRACLRCLVARCRRDRAQSMLHLLEPLGDIAYNLEALRMTWGPSGTCQSATAHAHRKPSALSPTPAVND